MAEFLLGIDAGGTAVKVAVISADGRECGVAGTTLRAGHPAPGFSERDPDAMWQALCDNTRRAMALAGIGAGDIAAIGVTGYGNGFYLIDAAGHPTTPGILAPDIRAAEVIADWQRDGRDAAQLERTWQHAWAGKPGPLLAWFQRHRPQVLRDSATLLMCKDYLRYRLTGIRAAEVSDLSTSGQIPGDRRAIDAELFEILGLDDCLRLMPPVIESMTVAGELTSAAAEAMGLKPGIPVSAGCCDNLAIMYGSGVTGTDTVVVVSGTWGLHQSFIEKPVTDGSLVICGHGAVPGEYLAIEGSPTSASTLEWFVDTFVRGHVAPGSGKDQSDPYEDCNQAVAATSADDPPVYFMPYLNGAIDDAAARGSLIGFSAWHGFGHMVRAVYEGVAFEHRRHLERLLTARPRPAKARFAGGAARSAIWSEIFAASLDLPLEKPRATELGALGIAIQASVATGRHRDLAGACAAMTGVSHTVMPQPGLRRQLDRRYHVYRELSAALAPHWRNIAPSEIVAAGAADDKSIERQEDKMARSTGR
ncbi:MAG TPA: FGGY-family carbohydrate kinase [Dongiaceae bacterium]|nr:FGGY-family carbohydrate kinase [Dongiaceae bacterium]